MRERVCIGGHEFETFRSLRLLGRDGQNMPVDSPLNVGDVWDLELSQRENVTPPHVEDVLVRRGHHIERIEPLGDFLRERAQPWRGDASGVFDSCLATSASGRGYVPVGGPLPARSTGYWLPDTPLRRQLFDDSINYRCAQTSQLRLIRYVGIDDGPAVIRVGDLVRVSLLRRFQSSAGDSGFWLQLSGVFPLG